MRCTVDSAALAAAIATGLPLVSTAGSKDGGKSGLLEHVELTANDAGELVARIAGMGAAVRVRVPAEVDASGTCMPPAKALHSALRRMDGDVAIWDEGIRVYVSAGKKRKASLFSWADVDVYPTLLPPVPPDTRISAVSLGTVLDAVAHAQATERHPEHAGVHLEVGGGRVRAVATNHHRLAVAEAELAAAPHEAWTTTIARDGVQVLQLALAGDDGVLTYRAEDVELGFDPLSHRLGVYVGTTSIDARCLGQGWPGYASLLRPRGPDMATVDRVALLQKLKLASIFLPHTRRLMLLMSEGKLTLHTHEVRTGDLVDSMVAQTAGRPRDVGINHRYLVDALHALEDERVELCFGASGTDALVVRPVGRDDQVEVIAPLQAADAAAA